MDSRDKHVKKTIHSAVMVIEDLSTNALILTKRSKALRYHPGEICFPGGLQDLGDENLYQTALRELHEEIGVSAERVTLIDALQREATLRGAIIQPFLATIDSINPYKLNPQEVTSLISIPIILVLEPSNYKELPIVRYGHTLTTYEFIPCEERIWGATARIMYNLALRERS